MNFYDVNLNANKNYYSNDPNSINWDICDQHHLEENQRDLFPCHGPNVVPVLIFVERHNYRLQSFIKAVDIRLMTLFFYLFKFLLNLFNMVFDFEGDNLDEPKIEALVKKIHEMHRFWSLVVKYLSYISL